MRELGLTFAFVICLSAACAGETTRDAVPATGGSVATGGAAGSSATASGGAGSPAKGGAAGSTQAGGTTASTGGTTASTGGTTGGQSDVGGGAAGIAGGAMGGAAGSGDMGGAGGNPSAGQGGDLGGAANQCPGALSIGCGDSVNHSTLVEGRAGQWFAYGRTARSESGRETVYAFQSASDCTVFATLKNLTTDLDLLLLSACSPSANEAASPTPLDLQTVETLTWTNRADQTHYVVVDGHAGEEGSYTLEISCACQ